MGARVNVYVQYSFPRRVELLLDGRRLASGPHNQAPRVAPRPYQALPDPPRPPPRGDRPSSRLRGKGGARGG